MMEKVVNIPLTLRKDQNTILLSWDNLILDLGNLNFEFVLYLKSKQGWKYVYSGTESRYSVNNLEPSTCYTFKLKIFVGDRLINTTKFKATTDFEPFHNFHVTRAIIRGKLPLLKKIISQRPILLELESKDHKTPLHVVAESGDLSMANVLISLGANVNNPLMSNKRTPLMTALFHGNLQIAALLLDKGADSSLTDCNGLTAMHHAVDSGRLESVEFAIEREFDVNVPDTNGWTPLLRAVIMECGDIIIQVLISNGADKTVKDRNGFDFYKHCEIAGRVVNI